MEIVGELVFWLEYGDTLAFVEAYCVWQEYTASLLTGAEQCEVVSLEDVASLPEEELEANSEDVRVETLRPESDEAVELTRDSG